MKTLSLLLRLALLGSTVVATPRADDTPPERAALAIDPASGAWSFNWWGVSGRTYFVQNSDLNLANWTYWPVIEQGAGAPISYGFWLNPRPDRLFLRLRYTDQATTNPYGADFDSDGIPNGWEIENGLNPFDTSDSANTSGGLTYHQIYLLSHGGGADPAALNPVGLMVYSP
jgi:hypothetical protein